MKKHSLFIDHVDYRFCYSPVVAVMLRKRLENPPIQAKKRRKIDWIQIMSEPNFTLELKEGSEI